MWNSKNVCTIANNGNNTWTGCPGWSRRVKGGSILHSINNQLYLGCRSCWKIVCISYFVAGVRRAGKVEKSWWSKSARYGQRKGRNKSVYLWMYMFCCRLYSVHRVIFMVNWLKNVYEPAVALIYFYFRTHSLILQQSERWRQRPVATFINISILRFES